MSAAALVLWRPGTLAWAIVGMIDGESRRKFFLPPARDKSFKLCRRLRRILIGLGRGEGRVMGLRMTLSAYLGSRFAEMREVSNVS